MTNVELHYFEYVPRELRRIADALEKLNRLIEKSVEKPETEKDQV